jgi:phage gpG-like protein
MLPQRMYADDVEGAFRDWAQQIITETYEVPLMALAPVVFYDFDQHFSNAAGPYGAWAVRTRQYPWPILVKTGALQYAAGTQGARGNIDRWNAGWAEFGVDGSIVNYAGFHEYGTSRMPARPWCWLSPEAEDKAAAQFLDAVYALFVG